MAPTEPKPRSAIHTFDIDKYLNHLVPRQRFYLLPRPISHFLGYRPPVKDPASAKPSTPTSNLLVWLFAFIGGFCGIAIIENVYLALPQLNGHQAPIVIASFGAAAILEYNTIESPLSQPRNLILGHFLSATLGVSITKLFLHLPPQRFEELKWLAGALSVGIASTAMSVTKTVHPPAGATALLAATNPEVMVLGWWLLPLVLLACCLMLASALIINNIYKRFPLYWWTPVDLATMRSTKQPNTVRVKDVEKADTDSSADLASDSGLPQRKIEQDLASESDVTHVQSIGSVHNSVTIDMPKKLSSTMEETTEFKISICKDRIIVPDWMILSEFDTEVLDTFQSRLRAQADR